MTPLVRPRHLGRLGRLVVSATVAAVTVGLSALPAHAGWNNHNETLLRHRRD